MYKPCLDILADGSVAKIDILSVMLSHSGDRRQRSVRHLQSLDVPTAMLKLISSPFWKEDSYEKELKLSSQRCGFKVAGPRA